MAILRIRFFLHIILLLSLPTCCSITVMAQDSHKYHLFSYDPNDQIDLVDLGRSLLRGSSSKRIDTVHQKTGKLHISALPVAGYTLQTGFAGVLSSNFAFYT